MRGRNWGGGEGGERRGGIGGMTVYLFSTGNVVLGRKLIDQIHGFGPNSRACF